MSTITAPAKPRLRGALHAIVFPFVVIAGIVLTVAAPTTQSTVACAVFTVTSALLFGTSGYYHRGTHSPRVEEVLRRLDHANIYLIIAGTYTPFALIALSGTASLTVMLVIWIGAVSGVVFRTLWMGAPRWLYTGLYIALGWVAVFFIPQFLAGVGVLAVVLIVAGGLCYSVGGVVYGLKRPNPWPDWFGFHEIFHTLTVVAWICHFSAVALVIAAAS
ncbi:PAQR family membrane homeostasis protein TrhA [Stackebrandtia soli]|uniref:PAQR family membrane homeostasis protein TrhA n=1 Tax=Stackebrandtia soli TaxID=1892856 RepID=UPI0039E83AA5